MKNEMPKLKSPSLNDVARIKRTHILPNLGNTGKNIIFAVIDNFSFNAKENVKFF